MPSVDPSLPRYGRARAFLAAVALCVSVASTVGAPAAQAAAPVPATPSFPSTIDRYAGYDPEDTCSPTAKPGPLALSALLVRTYGTRGINNIVRPCRSRTSGHEEGRSLDFGFDAANSTQRAEAYALLGWLLATDRHGNPHANARRLGIMYVQYNNKMWRAYQAGSGWQPQLLSVNKVKRDCATLPSTYVTACHRDHIHFSFSWDGAYKRTSFFTGRLACQPGARNTTPPVLPTAAGALVAVTPATLLDSRTGVGQPGGPCAPSSTSRYDVQVTGRGGVPTTGVTAVDLLLTVTRPSTASTFVSLAPSGVPWTRSGGAYATTARTGQSMVHVPVGTDGKVSVSVSSGMADVSFVVTGYRTSGAGQRYSAIRSATFYATGSSPLPGGQRRAVQVTGRGGVPAGASAVTVTLSAWASTAGTVGVQRGGETGGAVAWLRVPAGGRRSVPVTVPLSSAGTVQLVNAGGSTVGAMLTVHGYWGDTGSTGRLVAVTPVVLVDTWRAVGHSGHLPAGKTVTLQATGVAGVPADAKAVVLDLSATSGTSATGVWGWAAGTSRPVGAWRYLDASRTDVNSLVVPVGAGGKIALLSSAGTLGAYGRIVGYYA